MVSSRWALYDFEHPWIATCKDVWRCPAFAIPDSVTHLHPELLFDKLEAGGLSAIERRQLGAHAAKCKACSFELSIRDDLAIDSLKHTLARDWSSLASFGSGA